MENIREAALLASQTIGLSFTRLSKTYSIDDELFKLFYNNFKGAIPAFRFLASQSTRIAHKCWPRFFKSCHRTIMLLLQLLAEDALHFDDIDSFYSLFDAMQTTSESFFVHPKERQFTIPSIQLELEKYRTLFDHLEAQVVGLAQLHADQLKQRTDVIVARLKECSKAIADRNALAKRSTKLEKKARVFAEKGSALDVLKQAELAGLEALLEFTRAAYEAKNANIKLVLPEFLLLVEEFTDTVTKWTVSFHHQQIHEVQKALEYVTVFHGFGTSKKATQDYGAIIDQWESDITSTRVQLESFIQILYSRNPDRVVEEIDAKDGVLKATKLWSQVTLSVRNKHHIVKADDSKYGIFNEDMMSDPLVSFAKYQNPHANLSETYHPSRVIEYEEIHVSAREVPEPPVLPPRNLGHEIFLPNKVALRSPVSREFDWDSPVSTLHSSHSTKSLSPLSSGSEFALHYTESDDVASQNDFSGPFADGDKFAQSTQRLLGLYNCAKNDIKECPTLPSKYEGPDFSVQPLNDSQLNSVTFDMHKLYSFFDKTLSLAD